MKRTPVEDIVKKSMHGAAEKTVDRAAIERYQFGRLRQTVEFAMANSPFYRQRLAETTPAEIIGYEALSRLPFTPEEDLRHSAQDMLCVGQDEVACIITMQSSGTTGSPKRLFFTEDDLDRTIDFFHQGMRTLVEPGQRVLILLPGATPDSTGDLLARALLRMDVESKIYGLVVHPQTAVQHLPGDWGEIVFSTLTRRGMPLIRYRTGDFGRLLDGQCVCGSHIMRLDKVLGRISQVRQLANGQTLSMDLLDFQAELQQENNRDKFILYLTSLPKSSDQVLQHVAMQLKRVAQLENIEVVLEENPTCLINKGKCIIVDNRGKISHETAYQAGL